MQPRAISTPKHLISSLIAGVGLTLVSIFYQLYFSLITLTYFKPLATIMDALEGNSKDVFDSLIARGWNVNSNLGHVGNALMSAAFPF